MTETGLNTMMGEAAKSIQESGGKHVGVFEAKIIMAGRVLIILTVLGVDLSLIPPIIGTFATTAPLLLSPYAAIALALEAIDAEQ